MHGQQCAHDTQVSNVHAALVCTVCMATTSVAATRGLNGHVRTSNEVTAHRSKGKGRRLSKRGGMPSSIVCTMAGEVICA